MAPDDVRVIEDTERRFEDNTVLRVRVLSVPESEKFPDGVKYRLHYGTESGDTLIRYDNSHGHHERHTVDGLDESYEFPGYDEIQRRFWDEVKQVRDEAEQPKTQDTMTNNTLIVTVESIGEIQQRTADAFKQALATESSVTDTPYRLSFETTDQLARVFTPRAIDLLQVIAQQEPASIREAARLVDRDIKQVSENLERLDEYGVVEFVDEGRAKRPVVGYDEIDIQLPLRQTEDTDTAAV